MNIGIPFLEQIRAGGGDVTSTSGAGDFGGGAPPPVDANADTGAGQTGWGWLAATLSQIAAAITSSYHTEHNTNDTHKTIHASGAIYERARTVAIGDWTDLALDAANFGGGGAMTWAVTQAQQIALSYSQLGTTLYLNYWIEGATLGGTASPSLTLRLPLGLRVAQYASTPFYAFNSTATTGRVTATPGDRFLSLYKTDSANWAIGSTVTVQGQIAIKVAGTASDGGAVTVVDPVLTYTGGFVNFGSNATKAFPTPGTFTMSVNRAMTLSLSAVAGGGGGGSGSDMGAGGGGGGETSRGTLASLVPGKVYTLVVGAAGAGASSANTAGASGTNTTWVNTTDTVTLVSLVAGTGGKYGAEAGGAVADGGGSGGAAGGTGGTGTARTAGGTGGKGGDPGLVNPTAVAAPTAGANATNAAAGGGGGGGVGPQANAAGGDGSVAHTLQQGGGATFTGASGNFGYGGGGGSVAVNTPGGTGGTGAAVLTFVSAP